MESADDKELAQSFSYTVARILFPLLLLLSLDGLWAAERANIRDQYPGVIATWYRHFAITLPWLSTLMGGTIIWLLARRKQLDKQTAAVLLTLFSFAASAAYEVLGKFAAGR